MDFVQLLPDLPIQNPTLIFSVVLSIILLSPILLQKLRVPHIIGLILAGMAVGPHGLGILERDMSFKLFGQVGLLYLMFLAGLEMDIHEFKKNKSKGIVFGLFTFLIPMIMGTLAGYYILSLSWIQSILLASMFASHTLVAYPIISRYGIAKKKAVTMTIAGTIVTVLLALLILAIITAMYRGELNQMFWVKFSLSIMLYLLMIFLIFPSVCRWFLRKYDDNVSQYIFVLLVVFAASFTAELSGLESIIGAFLAGIILNRYIPSVSPLMNRIEFVGNALFIPFFLMGVGMLVDLRVLFMGTEALVVALTMSVVATASKWSAAYITQKSFSMTKVERQLVFGLTNGQAAATLAAVLIGYNIITGTNPNGNPIRLLDENILNGTILMILITCTISSIWTENAAREIATEPEEDVNDVESKVLDERILIPVANPATINNLVNLAMMIKDNKKRLPLYALSVEMEQQDATKSVNKPNVLNEVAKISAAADTPSKLICRYDLNIASGIVHTVKENKITDIIVGFHHKADIADTFFGPTTQNILRRTNRMMLILKALTPIQTINKMIVCVPPKAEFETGFERWIDRLAKMAMQIGCRIVIHCGERTEAHIRTKVEKRKYQIRLEYYRMDTVNEFVGLKDQMHEHDLLVIVCARPTSISFNSVFELLPGILSRDFSKANLLVIYPEQFSEAVEEIDNFYDPGARNLDRVSFRLDRLFKRR